MEQNKDMLIWIFVAVALLLFLGIFGMSGYGMMGAGMGFGLIFMLLFLGLIIWFIVTLINAIQSKEKDHREDNREKDHSLTILKKRYASGELTKKQFNEMKKDLKGD